MERTLICLPDGTEIFSGASGNAVMECTVTRAVSNGKELSPGSVCAAMAEITVLEAQPLSIGAGDVLTLYGVDEEGNRKKIGDFLAQKPQRTGHVLQLTAYDRLRLLDQDISSFLTELDGWPYSLLQLAELCCEKCGLRLQNQDIPNGSFPVERFPGEGVTGRMLMEWIAQACGCFCMADPEGQAVLTWYTPATVSVGPKARYGANWRYYSGRMDVTVEDAQITSQDGAVQLDSPYITVISQDPVAVELDTGLLSQYAMEGGICLEEMPTQPIAKVVLRQKDTDVGTAWPENTDGCALCITGNPLLAAKNAETLLPVAQTLYERFGGICYTPGTVKVPGGVFEVGQQLRVMDQGGTVHTFYCMQLQRSATADIFTCTGSALRETVEAVENRSARSLAGRILSLRADVDGLHAENADNQGKIARLELDVGGIRGQVSSLSGQETRLTALEQTAQGLTLSVERLRTDGADKLKTAMGYTFDDSGLRISKEGQQMENLLDNTGMYVKRGGQTILQANDRGVTAVDVTVGSYLVIGDHARLENYTAGRTACFWLEGNNGT